MSKLYSYTYMSLDGVIESPEQWSSPFFSDEMGRDLTSRLESASAGSGTLVRDWIRRGTVDEVVLMVCPVLVAAGKRLFENGTTTTLKQVGVEQFPRGVMALTYAPTT
jgi:dihydrofolate reductase